MKAKFPGRKYPELDVFLADYASAMAAALHSVGSAEIDRAVTALKRAIRGDRAIFACGNGGSAALANHRACDCSKGIATDTALRPRVVSLSATVELITAIANDVDYAEIFTHQLRNVARSGDVLITISSSGDSEDIVRALAWAADNGVTTIALTGVSGGRSAAMADINLHAAAAHYRIGQEGHQSAVHSLAQYGPMA